MKFLADENLELLIVNWLREYGHDVDYAAESAVAESDVALLTRAIDDRRVVITNDLDFGELVYRFHRPAFGIVLLRLRVATDADQLARLQPHWGNILANCVGNFVVVSEKKIRVRKLTLV